MVTTWLWRLLMQINFWPINARPKTPNAKISGALDRKGGRRGRYAGSHVRGWVVKNSWVASKNCLFPDAQFADIQSCHLKHDGVGPCTSAFWHCANPHRYSPARVAFRIHNIRRCGCDGQQHCCEVNQILRPEHEAENIKLARCQIEKQD
jgi:hypothetical protein